MRDVKEMAIGARFALVLSIAATGCSGGFLGGVSPDAGASVSSQALDEGGSDSRAALERVSRLMGAQQGNNSPNVFASSASTTTWQREGARLVPSFGDASTTGTATASSVKVALPTTADGSVEITGQESGMAIQFALRGASPVPPELSQGHIVYRNALGAGGDVIHHAWSVGTEDFVVLPNASRGSSIEYDVQIGAGVAGLRLVAGVLEFVDGKGTPIVHVARPYVVDSIGTRTNAKIDVPDCAVDGQAAPPWGRAVVAPGASRCTVRVSWASETVNYPAVLDPAWTSSGSLITPRDTHVAVRLGDGRVLLAGGQQFGVSATDAAELFDPITGTFTATGNMTQGRRGAAGVLLGDGRVLVTGGEICDAGGCNPDESTEVFNMAGGTFTATASMATARSHHGMTLLADGRVFVAGGLGNTSAEIWDPSNNSWSPTGAMSVARGYFSLVTLLDHRVLAAGGLSQTGGTTLASTEVWDPNTLLWSNLGSLQIARQGQGTALLPDGTAFVVGGSTTNIVIGDQPPRGPDAASAERLLPGATTWVSAGTPAIARELLTATALPDGTVLLAGGRSCNGITCTDTSTTELWNPLSNTWVSAGSLSAPRALATATLLLDGRILIAGGDVEPAGTLQSTAELYGCTKNSQCASNFCVDGMCCDTACGGGDTTDCQACSISASATQNGTCGPTGGNTCDVNHVNGTCGGAGCTGTCVTGYADCNGLPADGCETNTATSTTNCGACGTACSTNNVVAACASGACSGTCIPGHADCNHNLRSDGCEVATSTDPSNCGGCALACSSNHVTPACVGGACTGSCSGGFADCDHNLQSDGCESGINTDPHNCGGCSIVCSTTNIVPSCAGGACTGSCNPGYGDCDHNLQSDGCETALLTDPNNCGACASACSANNLAFRTCDGGGCDGVCAVGYFDCNGNKRSDGCEVNGNSDPLNCGGCAQTCSVNHVVAPSCTVGVCTGMCAAGYADCNANLRADGCEASLLNDANNCGACGQACTFLGGLGGCVNGACAQPTTNTALTADLSLLQQVAATLATILPQHINDDVSHKLIGGGSASDHLVQAQQKIAQNHAEDAIHEVINALDPLNDAINQVANNAPCKPNDNHINNDQNALSASVSTQAIGLLNFAVNRVTQTASLMCVSATNINDCQYKGAQIALFPPQLPAAIGGAIHGYIAAIVSQGHDVCAQVEVPDIKVWLQDPLSGKKTGSAVTNAQGFFQLNNIPAGDYFVCSSGTGYQTVCDPQVTTVASNIVYLDHKAPIYPQQTAVWGTVRLADGKTPCFTYSAAFNTLVQASVTLVDANSHVIAGPFNGNSLGQYVVPSPVIAGNLTVKAVCEAATGSATAVTSPMPANPYDIVVGNKPPGLSEISFSQNGVGIRRADPGAVVHAAASATDPDGDALHYAWIDESGRVLNLPDAAEIDWTLLPLGANNTLDLQVSDGKGGYAFLHHVITGGPNELYFAGTATDRGGQPVPGASVTLNGVATTTGAKGNFSLTVPDAPNFVLNVHTSTHALVSQVLYRPASGIRVVMDKMIVSPPINVSANGGGGTVTFSPEPSPTHAYQSFKRSFSVTFAPGSLLDANNNPYNGNATVYGWPYDLNAPNPIPGDQGAIHNGKSTFLGTYGSFDVVPTETGNGSLLHLAPGQSANVTLLIQDDRKGAMAPPTIPFFLYDQTTGVWRDHGTLTKVKDDTYSGTIQHFSQFNADSTWETAYKDSACVRVHFVPGTFPQFVSLHGFYTQANGQPDPNLTPFLHPFEPVDTDDPNDLGVLRLIPGQNFELQVYDITQTTLLAQLGINSGPALTLPDGSLLHDPMTGLPDYGVPANPSWTDCNGPYDLSGAVPFNPANPNPLFLIPVSLKGNAGNSMAYAAATEAVQGKAKGTLGQWLSANGFGQNPLLDDPLDPLKVPPATDAHAYYFNNGDLQFGRDMHCHSEMRANNNFHVACYVTNYGTAGVPFTGVEMHQAIQAQGSPATVCMEYDSVPPSGVPDSNVQFWAYVGPVFSDGTMQSNAPLLTPTLDAQGAKPIPDMCQACHGGGYDSQHNLATGAIFLPFDLKSFIYDTQMQDAFNDTDIKNNIPGPTYSLNLGDPFDIQNPHAKDAQEQFRRLNYLVSQTNPDALQHRVAPNESVKSLLATWYPGNCLPNANACQFVANPAIPAFGGDATPFKGEEPLYNDVVANVCRTCHIAHGTFDNWTAFNQFNSSISYKTCVTSPPDQTDNLTMPHAQVPFLRFWGNGTDPAAVSTFAAEVKIQGGCSSGQ